MHPIITLRLIMNGHTFIGVMPQGPTKPAFVYSLGLVMRGWPELLLIGNVPPVVANSLLEDIIARWELDGPGTGDIGDLIMGENDEPMTLRLVEVEPDSTIRDYAVQLANYFPDEHPRIVQVMWPDPSGKFPNEPGYETRYTQPALAPIVLH